jgi:hypothetical protein
MPYKTKHTRSGLLRNAELEVTFGVQLKSPQRITGASFQVFETA